MKKTLICVAVISIASCAYAGMQGAVSTDRFGYTGTAKKYATLEDAQNGTNLIEEITIGNRDLALYIVNDYASYDSNYNIIMGSWWYTTVENTNGKPKDDPAGDRLYSGWGNTRGNTGVGFIQLYDEDGSTDTTVSMEFKDPVGSCWTKFELSVSGINAIYDNNDPSNDYARFSPFTSNTNDKGIYHTYSLSLVATGLQGQETSPGLIEASNHPTDVTGTYTGLFENTTTDPDKQGFYVFNLTLDMENWAFAQGDEALNGNFYESYFAVPEPATICLLGLGALSLLRRKK